MEQSFRGSCGPLIECMISSRFNHQVYLVPVLGMTGSSHSVQSEKVELKQCWMRPLLLGNDVWKCLLGWDPYLLLNTTNNWCTNQRCGMILTPKYFSMMEDKTFKDVFMHWNGFIQSSPCCQTPGSLYDCYFILNGSLNRWSCGSVRKGVSGWNLSWQGKEMQ